MTKWPFKDADLAFLHSLGRQQTLQMAPIQLVGASRILTCLGKVKTASILNLWQPFKIDNLDWWARLEPTYSHMNSSVFDLDYVSTEEPAILRYFILRLESKIFLRWLSCQTNVRGFVRSVSQLWLWHSGLHVPYSYILTLKQESFLTIYLAVSRAPVLSSYIFQNLRKNVINEKIFYIQ